MQHLSSNDERKFTKMIENHLSNLNPQSLKEFGKKLFPLMTSGNIYISLYNCLHTFFSMRINKNESTEAISNEIIRLSQEVKDESIHSKVRDLLEDLNFTHGLSEQIKQQNQRRRDTIHAENGTQKSNGQTNHQNGQLNGSKVDSKSGFDLGSAKSKAQKSMPAPIVNLDDDSEPQKCKAVLNISQKTPQSVQVKTGSNSFADLNSDPYEVVNLLHKNACLCGKSCATIKPGKDYSFKCYHCKLQFHIQCMQRGKNAINETDPIKKLLSCSFCHLQNIVPTKRVGKTLFQGILKQGRKRHGLTFKLDMTELKSRRYKLQVRCFRIKEKIQTFVLFPDSAAFTVNNRFEKEFLPLPKQSSLKYRKDEPFYLTQHLINHENKITIVERIPKKQSKEDRIEPENHLIGLYLVEDLQIPTIVKEIRTQPSVYTFHQSKQMLERSFRIGDSEDITCEIVKIPIVCSLTIERIKTPVRGIFCSHYQCFDLNNYLMMTSSSTNPRWLCPLCKQPTYEFKYDIIIGSIIEQYAKLQPTEIMFSIDGGFKLKNNEDFCDGEVCNINDLIIDEKWKRPIAFDDNEQELKINGKTVCNSEELEAEQNEKILNGDADENFIQEERKVADDGSGQNGLRHQQPSKGQQKSGSTPITNSQSKEDFCMPEDASIIDLDDD